MVVMQPGTLRVTLQFARDIKDCDAWGRQDPYVKLHVGSVEKRSKTCVDGGRMPVWDETFEFNIFDDNTLSLTIMDSDRGLKDDVIGTASVSLSKAREQGTDSVQAPVSSGKKQHKQQGYIQVQLKFEPVAKPASAAAPVTMAAAPPHMMAAYGGGMPMMMMGPQQQMPHVQMHMQMPAAGAAAVPMMMMHPAGAAMPMMMPTTAGGTAAGSFVYAYPQQR